MINLLTLHTGFSPINSPGDAFLKGDYYGVRGGEFKPLFNQTVHYSMNSLLLYVDTYS